jgi:cell division protein FtsB
MQYWVIMLIAVAFAFYYHFRPLPGNEVALQKIAALTEEKAQLQARHDRLSRRIAWLKDEKTPYLEMAATDLLGWQREGQVILRLPQPTRP